MNKNNRLNTRTIQRKGYAVSHTVISNLGCIALALITTALIWLSGAF